MILLAEAGTTAVLKAAEKRTNEKTKRKEYRAIAPPWADVRFMNEPRAQSAYYLQAIEDICLPSALS